MKKLLIENLILLVVMTIGFYWFNKLTFDFEPMTMDHVVLFGGSFIITKGILNVIFWLKKV